jgi:hypothetical protein
MRKKTVGEDAALEVSGELAFYVARQPAALGVGVAKHRTTQ